MTTLTPGDLFADRFSIDSHAGSGGMGAVYRAHDRHTGSWVALKLLHGGHDGAQESERFTREAQLLAELRHPHIVAHVAHGETPDHRLYLAMEWLEGEDLAARLRRGPLSVSEAELLLARIADGLAVAHRRGVLHRDLKPHNLFLPAGQLERVKILDFGIARRLATPRGMTNTGVVIGTPEYMAPEQARGAHDITLAADVFALGCVFYECLTGHPPFVGDHLAAVLVRILFEEPTPVCERRPDVPLAISGLVRRMLTKAVHQRLPDAMALQAALASLHRAEDALTASTLVAPAPPILRFSAEDQRLFSIVIARPSATHGAESDDPERRQSLLGALGTFGVRGEFLLDGALVVTIDAPGSLTDQAAHAARVAILIKERWPEAAVAVATGRGVVTGHKPVGEVVSRALTLLAHQHDGAGDEPTSGVWVDTLSAQLMEHRFRLTTSDTATLLLGEHQTIDAGRLLLGKPTPCCGRELELGTLDMQLQSCIDESEARAILITAPPGSGKSRLRHEFLRRLAQAGQPRERLTTIVAQGEMMSAGVPYGLLTRAVRTLCGLRGGEPLAEQRARLASRLGQHLPEAERAATLVFLGELAGVSRTDEQHPLLLAAKQDPKLLQEQVRRAFVGWLRAECEAAPVVVVLDDLHWGDALTVSLIDAALRQLRGLPLLLVALGRPEVHALFPRLWAEHYVQELALKGLSRRACERLIQQVLGKDVSPAVTARIVEQAAGNPLYLEELIRAAAEGKGDDTSETVLAMLQARVSRLAVATRRVLGGASIFGQIFWTGGVARLLGCDPDAPEFERCLRELTEAEIVAPHDDSQIAGEREYGFRHALMRDAAYGLLGDADRVVGHCAAAEHLAHRPDAGSHWLAALALLDTLPETNDNRRRRVGITLSLMNVSRSSDVPEHNLKLLQHAADSAEAIPADARTGEQQQQHALLHYWLGYSYYLLNQTAQAVKYFQHVLAQPIDDEQLMALPRGAIGRVKVFLGHIGEALPLLERAAGAAVDRAALLMESMLAEAFYGIALTEAGRCDEGLAVCRRSVARADGLKIPGLIPPTRGPLATILLLRGEYQDALSLLDVGIRTARETGAQVYLYLLHYTSAWALAKLDRHADSQAAMDECLKIRDMLGQRVIAPDWVAMILAEQALVRGDPDEAARLAADAAAVATTQGGLMSGGLIQRIWALALLARRAPAADIRAHLDESARLFQTGGCALELVRTHAVYGSLYAREEDSEQARRCFAGASARLREYGLPGEADKVDRLSAG